MMIVYLFNQMFAFVHYQLQRYSLSAMFEIADSEKQCPECPVVLSNSPRHSYGDNILGLEEVKSRTGGFGFMFLLNRRVTSAYPIRSFHEVCVFYSVYFSTPYYLIRSFAYRFADLKTTRNHFDIFFCFCFCLPLFPTFLDNVKRV